MEIPSHIVKHLLALRGDCLSREHIEHAALFLMGDTCPLCEEFDMLLKANQIQIPNYILRAFNE